MFKPIVRILIKLFEFLGCVICVIYKYITDLKARRVLITNRKYSREWSLLNNVTWSTEGSAFANITYGGFTLITLLFLISKCINSFARPTITEKIFLIVGMLLFFAVGGLVYASLDQVPPELQDNSIILGTLSFIVAFIFLIDLGDPMGHQRSDHTQTEQTTILQSNVETQTSTLTPNLSNHLQSRLQSEIKELNIPNSKMVDVTPTSSPEITRIPPSNGFYFSGDQVDIVQTQMLPTVQQPIFAKILMPEKKRPFKKTITEPRKLSAHENLYNYERKPSSPYGITNNYRRESTVTAYSRRSYNLSDDENIDRPKPGKTGFVAQAARMWDRRARIERTELSTIV